MQCALATYLNYSLRKATLGASLETWMKCMPYSNPLFKCSLVEVKNQYALEITGNNIQYPEVIFGCIGRSFMFPLIKKPMRRHMPPKLLEYKPFQCTTPQPVGSSKIIRTEKNLYVMDTNHKIPTRWACMLFDFAFHNEDVYINEEPALRNTPELLHRLEEIPVKSIRNALLPQPYKIHIHTPGWSTPRGGFSPVAMDVLKLRCFKSLNYKNYLPVYTNDGIDIPFHEYLQNWMRLNHIVNTSYMASYMSGTSSYTTNLDVSTEELVIFYEILRRMKISASFTLH